MRHVWLAVVLVLCSGEAAAQCVEGPDAESERALQRAFEAQSAIEDHLEVAVVDRESRNLADRVQAAEREMDGEAEPERKPHRVTAQASLNYAATGVRGFAVCDAEVWQDAKLATQRMGFAAGVGARGIGRVEIRLFGVGDSLIQRDLTQYYPADKVAGAEAAVPGARGAGYGLWSTRLELLDWVSLTVGRSSSHEVDHYVGWSEDTDDDGNVDIVKSRREHWVNGGAPRTFLALGVPRLGTTDLVLGDGGQVERFAVASGWFVPRPRNAFAAFRVDTAYDGLLRSAVVGADVVPLGGVFELPELPTFRIGAAGEFAGKRANRVREMSVGARWGYSFQRLGLAVPGDFLALDLETGMYGGGRLLEVARRPLVPGVMATADAALPVFAILRLSAWAGVNRPQTILAVPDAVGRPEVGGSLYVSLSI